MRTFEQYLLDEMNDCKALGPDKKLTAGWIDFALRIYHLPDGKLAFYIHPAGVSGETLDFKVSGNALTPLYDTRRSA